VLRESPNQKPCLTHRKYASAGAPNHLRSVSSKVKKIPLETYSSDFLAIPFHSALLEKLVQRPMVWLFVNEVGEDPMGYVFHLIKTNVEGEWGEDCILEKKFCIFDYGLLD
jgi:hypothetical protein